MIDNENIPYQILKDETKVKEISGLNVLLIFKRRIISEIGNQFKELAR